MTILKNFFTLLYMSISCTNYAMNNQQETNEIDLNLKKYQNKLERKHQDFNKKIDRDLKHLKNNILEHLNTILILKPLSQYTLTNNEYKDMLLSDHIIKKFIKNNNIIKKTQLKSEIKKNPHSAGITWGNFLVDICIAQKKDTQLSHKLIKLLNNTAQELSKNKEKTIEPFDNLEKFQKKLAKKHKFFNETINRDLNTIKNNTLSYLHTTINTPIIKDNVPLNIKKYQQYELPEQWNVNDNLKKNLIWIPSIQQYNGWICGWMTLYNAHQIISPLLTKHFTHISDFITEVENHENNQYETRYKKFVTFQQKFAHELYLHQYYKTKNMKQCGPQLGRNSRTQTFNNNDKNIQELDQCLIPATNDDLDCMLKNGTISDFLRKNYNDTNYYVITIAEDHQISTVHKIGPNYNDFTYLKNYMPGYSSFYDICKASPQNCMAVIVYGSHIILLIKITLTNQQPYIIMMNSENIHDNSFKSETTGKVMKPLCNSFLNQ